MKNPSPGSYFGGFGRPGDGTVPIGAALTTMILFTPTALIACTIARVQRAATPASADDRAPRPDRTVSAPRIADCSVIESGFARSVTNVRTLLTNALGFRTTTVTL